jgi:metal-sulfur cluster biosynthetic enzyme
MPVTEQDVNEALRQVYDPEIPVNVVDLGLIYSVRIEPAEGESARVDVDMTMTTPGCPAHGMLTTSAKERIEQIPGVKEANVNLVWSPPWTPARLSSEAKKKLGME